MPVARVEQVSPAAPERHRHLCAIPVHDGLAQRVARGLPRSEIVPGVEHRVESGDVNIRLNGYHAQRGSLLTCRVVHEDTAEAGGRFLSIAKFVQSPIAKTGLKEKAVYQN